MSENLNFFLVKDLMLANMKAQFGLAAEESLTPVNRKHPNSPETTPQKKTSHKQWGWTFKSNRPKPEHN